MPHQLIYVPCDDSSSVLSGVYFRELKLKESSKSTWKHMFDWILTLERNSFPSNREKTRAREKVEKIIAIARKYECFCARVNYNIKIYKGTEKLK